MALDRDDLANFLKPEMVVDLLDIRPGEKIADFGCGAGFFTVLLGQRVGSAGMVYGLDVRQEALDATKAKARTAQVQNVQTVRADLERDRGTGLADESMGLLGCALEQVQRQLGHICGEIHDDVEERFLHPPRRG